MKIFFGLLFILFLLAAYWMLSNVTECEKLKNKEALSAVIGAKNADTDPNKSESCVKTAGIRKFTDPLLRKLGE